MSSCNAAISNRRTTWRWIAASDWRRRSRRGGKEAAWAPSPPHAPPFAQFEPDQETVGQHDQRGVTMEAMPQSALILIPAQQTLRFFMKLFDPVRAMGVLHHGHRRRAR